MSHLSLDWIAPRLSNYEPDALASRQRAAVALVLRSVADSDEVEMLFIRRAEHPMDPWSGHMALPGGRVDEADASPLDAAMRETHEEVGLDLQQHARAIGRLDDIQARSRRGPIALIISPFVFALDGRAAGDALRPDPSEVEEALWVSARRLLAPEARSTMSYEHQGEMMTLPCFRIDGRVIWGLTYRMLRSFFGAVQWKPGAPDTPLAP